MRLYPYFTVAESYGSDSVQAHYWRNRRAILPALIVIALDNLSGMLCGKMKRNSAPLYFASFMLFHQGKE